MRALPVVFAVLLAACVDKTDPRWQLDHDRIVVVRATPAHVPAGASATLDALVAHAGAPTDMESPVLAGVAPTAPAALSGAVAFDGTAWRVTAPSEAMLDAARGELGLDPGTPVPLEVVASFGSQPLVATKTVYLGDAVDNPTLGAVMVEGMTVTPSQALVIPTDTDAPLASTEDATFMVNWLTSCGTMHDDNEHAAFIHVQPTDSMMGELALVVRDPTGGVAWQVWQIHAELPLP